MNNSHESRWVRVPDDSAADRVAPRSPEPRSPRPTSIEPTSIEHARQRRNDVEARVREVLDALGVDPGDDPVRTAAGFLDRHDRGVPASDPGLSARDVARLKRQLEELRFALERAKGELAREAGQRAEAERRHRELEEATSTYRERLDTALDEVAVATRERAIASAEADILRRRVLELEAELESCVAARDRALTRVEDFERALRERDEQREVLRVEADTLLDELLAAQRSATDLRAQVRAVHEELQQVRQVAHADAETHLQNAVVEAMRLHEEAERAAQDIIERARAESEKIRQQALDTAADAGALDTAGPDAPPTGPTVTGAPGRDVVTELGLRVEQLERDMLKLRKRLRRTLHGETHTLH
jgi:chromosome segregation ATPase